MSDHPQSSVSTPRKNSSWIGWLLMLALVAAFVALAQTPAMADELPAEAAEKRMPKAAEAIIHGVGTGIEIAGVAVLVLGGLIATAFFLRHLLHRREFAEAYHNYRANLGRAILLGLEFLVAADIVNTVAIQPSFHNLGILGLIVLIRTALSFSLEVEIYGHWPWQESQFKAAPGGQPSPSAEKTPPSAG